MRAFTRTLKRIGCVCFCLIAVLVAAIALYALFMRYYYDIIRADVPVFFGNGFVLVEHPGMNNDGRRIVDEKGNVLVSEEVRALATEGDTVYGFRREWDRSGLVFKENVRRWFGFGTGPVSGVSRELFEKKGY